MQHAPLREKLASYGQWTYRGAWALEIVASLLGLATGIALGYQAFGTADPKSVTSTDLVLASAPFFMVAIAELTKIPIATLLFSASWVWKPLVFLFLIALAGITFETVFMGLERAVTLRQLRYDETAKKMAELQAQAKQLSEQEAKRDESLQKAQADLASLTKQAEDAHGAVQSQIDAITKQITGSTEMSPEEAQLAKRIADKKAERDSLKKERDTTIATAVAEFERQRDSYVKRIDDSRRQHDDQSVVRYQAELAKLPNPRPHIEAQYSARIDQLDKDISQLEAQLEEKQSQSVTAVDMARRQLENDRNDLRNKLESLDRQWQERIRVAGKELDDALDNAKSTVIEQQSRQEAIGKELGDLEKERIETARTDQVRRIAARIYGLKPEEVTNEQAGLISVVWFGSLAFLAALAGPVTAIVALALQSIASAEPHAPGKLSKLVRRMLLRWRWRRVRKVEVRVEVPVEKEVEKRVEVPVEVERVVKEILYVPLLTDDPDAVRRALNSALSKDVADLVSISVKGAEHAGAA